MAPWMGSRMCTAGDCNGSAAADRAALCFWSADTMTHTASRLRACPLLELQPVPRAVPCSARSLRWLARPRRDARRPLPTCSCAGERCSLPPASDRPPWRSGAIASRRQARRPNGWARLRARQLAGIDGRAPDPPGGEIVRDGRGAPTGILKEPAQDLVARAVPAPTADKLRRGILAALDLAARTGVTSVQSEVSPRELDIYRALRAEGRLTVRVYGWLPLTLEVVRALEQRGERAASGDAWVRTGLVKAYADGTLGSRTAWMLEPYSDDPSTRGIQRIPAPEMDALVLAADRAGLQ